MIKEVKISIRTLVEFIMRHGSVDNRYVGSVRAVEGTRAHQKIQKSYKENYQAEVPLKYEFVYDDIQIRVEGRADGILFEDDNVVIDEIKTTVRDLLTIDEDFNPLHWAQAKCYGYIYCKENNLEHIDIQITYYNIETMGIKYLRKTFDFKELEEFFLWLIDEYRLWAKIESEWKIKRDESIIELQFPFSKYREGQRELAVRVYKSIVEGKRCFAQAPTGIGKTISTMFPTIKAMGQGETSKVFYLTAKTITREVAEKSIFLMKEKGLNIKFVTITAKDKVCKMEEVNCNPENCPYADGYFDRINGALKDIIYNCNEYSRTEIDRLSDKYMLCPFELALDLTLWADIIICDYNYVFDPKVYLKRFFEVKSTDYTFLVDEAHNLVDRGREMYSAKLSKAEIWKVKKIIGKKDKGVANSLNKLNSYFLEKRKVLDELEQSFMVEEEEPLDIYSLIRIFLERADEYLANSREENKDLMDLYFNAHGFISMADFYDDKYVTLYEKTSDDTTIKLYCVDPSRVIQEKMDKGKSTIIFSATLLPMNYFKDIYGAKEDDYLVKLKSPFSTNNRLLMIGDNISTTYNNRENTAGEIVKYIAKCVISKKGNYMVFFPSYKYMEMIFNKLRENYPEINATIQETNMTEESKEEFLMKFNECNDESHVGFCVLGGHFSEGIDLTEDKLIGVIIIGVGMPQICVDRDTIKNHFNKEDSKGFEYAYVYPGMIKVLQGAGRCIRTENDKGVIMLLDSRYSQKRYLELFPGEWFPNNRVRNSDEIAQLCEKFWN